jgi:DNA-binding MarR family transcriptional regulator
LKQPPTMRELAEALVTDRSALGHTIRPLERDGLVALERDPEDRRRQYVVLTARGKAKHTEAKDLWQSAQDHFQRVFGKSNAAELRATLLRIAHDERLAGTAR